MTILSYKRYAFCVVVTDMLVKKTSQFTMEHVTRYQRVSILHRQSAEHLFVGLLMSLAQRHLTSLVYSPHSSVAVNVSRSYYQTLGETDP